MAHTVLFSSSKAILALGPAQARSNPTLPSAGLARAALSILIAHNVLELPLHSCPGDETDICFRGKQHQNANGKYNWVLLLEFKVQISSVALK